MTPSSFIIIDKEIKDMTNDELFHVLFHTVREYMLVKGTGYLREPIVEQDIKNLVKELETRLLPS